MTLRTVYALITLLLMAGCATTAPEPVSRNPELMAKEAAEFQSSHRYEDAIAQWKKVKESYASPEMTTLAEINIADAQFDNRAYIESAASYEEFRKLHPAHEKAAYALYRQGLSYYMQITGIDTDQTPVKNATTMFESFLRLYPTTEYAKDVQDKLEVCRMKQVEYEVYVARFYFRTERYAAAVKRLEGALKKYPRSPVHDETLFILGKSQILSGEKAKGRETFQRLFTEYQTSKYVNEARKFLDKNF